MRNMLDIKNIRLREEKSRRWTIALVPEPARTKPSQESWIKLRHDLSNLRHKVQCGWTGHSSGWALGSQAGGSHDSGSCTHMLQKSLTEGYVWARVQFLEWRADRCQGGSRPWPDVLQFRVASGHREQMTVSGWMTILQIKEEEVRQKWDNMATPSIRGSSMAWAT